MGTVEKRSLFFHGSIAQISAWQFHFSLSQLFNRQPVFVEDGKAVERGFPVVHRHGPFLRDVAQRQVEQFEDRLLVGKRAARFGHFAQRHIQ